MAENLGCWFIILKNVDFLVDNSILWNTQNAPDRTIFINCFSGEHAPGPPSTSVNQHHNRANYASGM